MALGSMFTTGGYRLGIPEEEGGGGEWLGNEPAAMTQLTSRAFNSISSSFGPASEDNWHDAYGGGALSIVTDATAPQSPSNVAQFMFVQGFNPGSSPCSTEFGTLPGEISKKILYGCYRHKFSSNWQGNRDINKMNYIDFTVGGASAVIAAIGEEADPMHLQIFMQALAGGGNFDSGATQVTNGTTTILRNVWNLIEVVLTCNTGSDLNGDMTIYLNGAQEATCSGIEYGAGDPLVARFLHQPVWGGGGPNVTNDMQQFVDHTYLSGKN